MLYPKLLMKIMQKTELSKQNPSNSKFTNFQKSTWPEIFDHKFFFRDEKDYNYFFLDVGNENDSKGLEKVIDIFPERNKQLWKTNAVNIWMKMLAGSVLNNIEDGKMDMGDYNDLLVMPPDDELGFEYYLPFEPKIHGKL